MRHSRDKCRYSCTVSLVRSLDLNVPVCIDQVIKALDACGSHMHANLLYSACSLASLMPDHNCTHARVISSK